MDGLNALQICTVLALVHATSGQTVTVSGPSRAAAATNTSLTCTLIAGETSDRIQWQDVTGDGGTIFYLGTTSLTDEPKYNNFDVTSLTLTESVLTIENAEVEDDGVYRCIIPLDTFGAEIDLMVEAPSIKTVSLTSIVAENEDLYVATCDAVGGKPQETITWTLNGVTQTDGNGNTIVESNPPVTAPLSNTKSVFTFPATPENNGQTLVCQVSGHDVLTDLNGQESKDLDIHTSPSDAGTTVTVDYATQGTSITVACTALIQPRPAMRNYYIFSNGTLIHDSMAEGNTFSVSDPEAGTEYTCMAGNYLGNTTQSAAVPYDPIRTTTPPPTTDPTPCTCMPTGLSSGASAAIAVLATLLVVSVIINIIQFIMLRRHETRPGFEESPKTVSREERHVSHEANDNMAFEMIQNGDRELPVSQ